MARGRAYDDVTKAAVMAALLAGQSIPQVAAEYNIPKGTLSDWRKYARRTVRNETTQKSDIPSIDVLLQNYVNENLTTLREQAKFFRDTSWLSKQEASSLAVLHGVLADKSIRLLEVFGGDPDVP